jgi:hypothetical protein
MSEPAPTPSNGTRALVVLPLVAAWVVLLVLPGLRPDWVAHSVLARFAPLGFLSVFAFPDQGLRLTRLLLVATPAFLLGASSAVLALAWGSGGLPGPSDLLYPALAVALGVVVALAWRRGPFALILLPFKMAFLVLLGAGLGLGLLLVLADRAPAVHAASPVTTEEKRQLVALFRDKDPRTLAPGEVSTLLLTEAQLDRLTAWLLPLGGRPGAARVRVALPAAETLAVRASLPLPLGRWLNGSASARVQVTRGELELRRPRLTVDRLRLPETLARALAPVLAAGVRSERRLRPLLAPIREARIERGLLRLSYARTDAIPGSVSDLLWGAATRPPAERPPEGRSP